METIVMYTFPGISHLVPTVEFAKLLLKHHPSFSITILIATPPITTAPTASYIATASTTTPSITFHHLPTTVPPQDPTTNPSFESSIFDLIRLSTPLVDAVLHSIALTTTIRAFIIDPFCTLVTSAAKELALPTYLFFTSSVSTLAFFLHFPTLDRDTTGNFNDMDIDIEIPNLISIHSSDIPDIIKIRNTTEYKGFLETSSKFTDLSGFITNSFELLEPKAVKALSNGSTPPIFCVGPLINPSSKAEADCLTWLDSQPSKSVVFLSFGSLGSFSKEQLIEIAVGLEKSEQRFLWVVRSPHDEDKKTRNLAPSDPDLDSLLPEGFLGRTKGRGLVVKSWAPQVEILSHESVGGFVTHCGWSSVLEAVCAGVPMVGWPLYGEQKFIRAVLVKEMKVALPMKSETKDGFVSWVEVEKRVRELMDSERGELVRRQTLVLRGGAKAALSEGGSSLNGLQKLVEAWKVR